MNKIIVFTSRFPFKMVGENFFESELEGIAKKYDEVYIVTANCSKKNPEVLKYLPENCKAISAERRSVKKDLIFGILKMPFCSFFYRELGEITKQKRKFIPALKRLVYCGAYYLGIVHCLPKIKDKIPLEKDDNVVIMSYWLSYIAAAAIKFKKVLNREDIKVVSRAHGPADIINLMTPNRFYPFQQFVLNKLDGVLAISDSGRDYLKSLSPRPEIIKRIYIGSYGSDEYIERKREPFTVMTCANFFVHKRVGIVAEAIKILEKKIPDIRWVHFGDGPLRESIETACAPISKNVVLKGNQPHDVLLSYLKEGEASVFVSASAAEGLPVSIMEAIAYSVPVVATDVNATNEAVITDKTGILVEADITPERLAESIYKIYEMSDEDYKNLCHGAYSHWQNLLDCTKNAEILSETLREY